MMKVTHLKWILITSLILFRLTVTGQVSVSIQVLPPYPTKFTDYASRPQQMVIMLTNTSTTAQSLQLRGAINGDNGITISTKPAFKSSSAIELAAGQTKSMNGNDLASFFDFGQLDYAGITQNEFINKGGLPEGQYRLCVRAYDYASNQPLSAEEPGGCSNTFTISSLEPPTILSPMDDQVISSGPGQIFTIRWNTPLSTSQSIRYKIRMVEILGNGNPNDAIMTATEPYFFEKEVTGNIYVYNPADPQLTPGRRYALMLEAFDPFENAVFRNNGRSEVIGFEYGELLKDTAATTAVIAAVKQDTLTLDARVVYRYDGSTTAHPYTGKVYLYKSYTLKEVGSQSVKEYQLNVGAINPDENEMVGSGNADANGNVHLVFGTNQTGEIPEAVKKAYPGTSVLSASYTLRLSNPYLSNPKQTIVFASGSTNAGELTAIPNSYALKVDLKKGFAKKGTGGYISEPLVIQSMAGLRTVIYRKSKAAGIPGFEGDRQLKAGEASGEQMLIVAEDTSTMVNENVKKSAIASFDNLLVSKSTDDTYWIAVFKANSTERLIDEPFKFESLSARAKLKSYANTPDEGMKSEKVNEYRYKVSTTLTAISTDPPLAKLRGRILYRYKDGVGGARPLANKNIRLVPVYVLSNPITRQQYVLGDNSYIVPVGANNQQNQGEPEKNWKDLPKINGDIDGVAGVTGSDGVFVMNEIPLWDSVMTFGGMYNIKKPIIPFIPPQKEMDADQFNNLKEGKLSELRDWRINSGDLASNVFNPNEGYGNSSGLIGGGVTGLNSPNVIIGGLKAGVVANKVSGPSAIQGGAIRGNQRGPSAPVAEEPTPADDELLSSAPLTLQRCYRVIVNEKYFLSPENNIIINPLDSIDAGTLYSDVKTFKARITVVGKDDKKRLANVKLSLRRRPERVVPDGESEQVPVRSFADKGKQIDYMFVTDQVFSQIDSNRNIFQHVLYDQSESYMMQLSTNDTANTLVSYKTKYQEIYANRGENPPDLSGTYNNEFKESLVDFRLEMEPKNPVIAGRLLGENGTTGIDGKYAEVRIRSSKGTELFVPVDKDGYFVYAPAQFDPAATWTISLNAHGYEMDRVANPPNNSTVTINGITYTSFLVTVNEPQVTQSYGWAVLEVGQLKMGQKVFKNFYFKPKSQLKGTVANAGGVPVPALFKVEGAGTLEETSRACTLIFGANSNTTPNTPKPVVNNSANSAGNNKKNNSANSKSQKPIDIDNNNGKSTGKTTQSGKEDGRRDLTFVGNNSSTCVESFNAGVPSGKPAKLIIIPNDLKYFNDTVEVASPAKGVTNLGVRTLITREHRFIIYVRGRKKNGQLVPISNAKVQILDSTLTAALTGQVRYSFANISQQNFWLKVSAPGTSPFVAKEVTLTNVESKQFKVYYIDLEEGDAVWGKVTLAGTVVPNAEVSISQGTDAPSIIAKTGVDGTYRIDGVKSAGTVGSQVDISASAGIQSNGTFIAGQVKKAALNTEVNFELSSYNELDVSKLLGYDVKITGVEKANGKTYLSGELIMPANAAFKPLDQTVKLTFNRLAVKANTQNKKNAKGITFAEPEGDITLDNLQYKTLLGGSYNVIVGNSFKFQNQAKGTGFKQAMIIKKQSAFSGALNGRARIVDNSFNFPESYLKFGDSEFYLTEKSGATFTQNLTINPASAEEGTQTTAQPTWYFSNTSGQALQFKFLGFSAVSQVEQNYYSNGKIRIKPVITAAVETPDNKPLVIDMPEVFFSAERVEGVNGTQPLQFNLENWKVSISKWKVATEEGGIVALDNSDNYVTTTAGLNVGFKTFRLRNDEMLIDNVNLSNLKLGGIKDLQINPGNVVFGLDNRTGNDLRKHFVLRLLGQNGQTAGKISGLPGFKQALDLEAVTLISNGEQYVDFATNSTAVKVYNVLNFKPIALEASQGGFRIAGNLDLGIPNLPELYGGFLYTAGSTVNSLNSQLDLKDIKLDLGTGYVQFASLADPSVDNGKKILSDGHLEIWGTVTEPGKLDKIPVKLTKIINGSNAAINIEQRPEVFAMRMGGNAKMILNVSRTWTQVTADKWDILQFTGKFDESYQKGGMGNDPLTFKVYGEIALDNTQVKLKDIKTPVGTLNIVFDWAKKEMRGTMQIQLANGDPIDIPGGIKFKGMAEVLMGVNGFYFVLAGDVNVQSVPLIFPLSAGILIAYHDNLPKEVFDKTSQYMYHKTYPCGLENGGSFKGFMLAGRKNVIDPVDFKIDILGIASADINLEVGFDATFYGNFSNGIEVSFMPGVFGDIALALSSPISCTDVDVKLKLSAMGRFLATIREGDATFTGALCMSLHMEGKVLQKLPTPIPTVCGNTIIDFDKGFTIGGMFGLRASTANGGKIEPFFKVIKSPCAENMNLLCN